ncbi:MAG: hypothetical protein JKY25_01945 [Robiginitomaculum sp.]|nr:hypothetical protein [Robiginitomaculum sp.]
MFNFRRSLHYAEYFKSFTIKIADTFKVVDKKGVSVPVVGMSCEELHDLLERFSEPPFFLVSITKLIPKRYSADEEQEFGCGPFMKPVKFDLNYRIQKHDCLILCSMI